MDESEKEVSLADDATTAKKDRALEPKMPASQELSQRHGADAADSDTETIVEEASSKGDGISIGTTSFVTDHGKENRGTESTEEVAPKSSERDDNSSNSNAGRNSFNSERESDTNISTATSGDVEDIQDKCPSDGESSSPPTMDDKLGRRKRKPSRYHDSMFDIPTNLMNINRTINPEEFRAFHSKSMKQKEKIKRNDPTSGVSKPAKSSKADDEEVLQADSTVNSGEQPCEAYQLDPAAMEDDTLDGNNIFKFKMRRDHIIQNFVGGPTAYRCDICMMTFPRSFSLRRHYTRRHINPKFVPKAGSTGAVDPVSSESPKTSLAECKVSKDSKFLYACKMCTKELLYFKHKNDLRVHCQENHSSEPRRPVSVFKCELCKRSYSTRHELERHKRTHSGERPYACGFCHKTFPTSTNARRHERTHTGDRPHICKVCNKRFLQRTDMVKHLRSIHKMKVTKTKAERGGSKHPVHGQNLTERKTCKTSSVEDKRGGYGTGKSNEFQENIDFAAYLKLDEHDSGTLMGEKSLPRGPLGPFLGKDKQSNNSNNCQTVEPLSDLRDLPPSEIMGEDGRPEKCHCCPECSKMFTSNINLRRHYKLKHERNQLYQSAEPVSMVVEKYKIKDEFVGTVLEPDNQIREKLEDENAGDEKATHIATEDLEHKVQTDKNEGTEHELPDGVSATDNEAEKPESSSNVTPGHLGVISPRNSKNKSRVGKLSKLSSIVQRLADKKNAEQPTELQDNDGFATLRREMSPITKLEEMESQIFKRSLSPDISGIPSKRNKRKPVNVQQVKLRDDYAVCSPSNERRKPVLDLPVYSSNNSAERMGDTPDPVTGGIFHRVFQNRNLKRPYNKPFRADRELTRQTDSVNYFQSEFHPSTSGIEKKLDVYQERSPNRDPEVLAETSRIEAFLSQCLRSRKRDVPQNAILNKNMPSRDTIAMNRNLKYNMRHLSNERMNEHLPPSAYFSQRDNLANIQNVASPSDMAQIFAHDSSPQGSLEREPILSDRPNSEKKQEVCVKLEDDAPLDLRVSSKKVVQDYVVRDDGVLDFSKRTRNSASGSPSIQAKPTNSMPLHSRIKFEAEMQNGPILQDRKAPMPFPAPHFDEIPPWLRSSHQKFLGNATGRLRSPLHPPMPEHRRDIVHGRPSSSRPRKPYKFHAMEFNQRPHEYSTADVRKSVPPHMLPYRESMYKPPRSMPQRGPIHSAYGKPFPMGMGPRWRGPKDEPMPYHGDRMIPHYPGHQHHPASPPFSVCNVEAMPVSRHHRNYDRSKAKDLPMKASHQQYPWNWHVHQKRDTHPTKMPPPHLRTILPKGMKREDTMKSRSPFASDRDLFSDQDMMTRCIRKAKQALKVEHSQDLNKASGSDLLLRDPVPVFKSSTTLPPYMQKIPGSLLSSTIANAKPAANSPKPPRMPGYMQQSTIPQAGHGVKSEVGMGVESNVDSSNILQGHAEDGSSERQKLIRTPDLESTHDDATESEKVESLVEDPSYSNSGSSIAEPHPNIEEETIASNITTKAAELENDAGETFRPKSCDATFETSQIQSMDMQHPDYLSDISGPKSVSPNARLNKYALEISRRRHTHASHTHKRKADYVSGPRVGLKRSSSSDTPQGETMSDESDGTNKKLIKKLKLRVIKSPGSEHKKYWTLVEQEAPKPAGNADNDTKPITGSEEYPEEKEYTTEARNFSVQILKDETVSKEKGTEEYGSRIDDTDEKIETDLIKAAGQLIVEELKSSEEFGGSIPDIARNQIEIEALNSQSTIIPTTCNSILTGSLVENALSAIAVPLKPESLALHDQIETCDEKLNNGAGLDLEPNLPKISTENVDDVGGELKLSEQQSVKVRWPQESLCSVEKTCQEECSDIAKKESDEEAASTMNQISYTENRLQARTTRSAVFNPTTSRTSTGKKAVSHPVKKIETAMATAKVETSSAAKNFDPSSAEKGTEPSFPAKKVEPLSPLKNDEPSLLTKKLDLSPAKKVEPLCPSKKAELSPPGGSASNRLRRSIRIRKSSSDKDTVMKKKK